MEPSTEKQNLLILATIAALNHKISVALQTGELGSIAYHFTVDSQLLLAGNYVISGRAAIQAFWQGVSDQGVKIFERQTMEVEQRSDLLYETGTYLIREESSTLLDRGTYLAVWKRADGQWRRHRDIWSSNF